MQRRTKWNCESIKITKNVVTEIDFNEKLERIWQVLQSLNCQPQKLFRPDANIIEIAVQDPTTNRRAA